MPNRHSQPYPAVGKVFFKIDGGIYVCSASITDSPGRSLVWTAGHCVRDAGRRGKFATKWVFVPGYDHGSAPYGRWPAKVLWSNAGWVNNNQHYDYSAAILKSKNGQRVQDAVGSSFRLTSIPTTTRPGRRSGIPRPTSGDRTCGTACPVSSAATSLAAAAPTRSGSAAT